MTRHRWLAALAGVVVWVPALAHGLHPTPLDGTDPHRGVMFDVEALDDLQVAGLALNVPSTDTQVVEVYYRVGSYVGHERSPEDWIPLGQATVTGQGAGNIAPIDLALTVQMSKGDVTGWYVDLPAAELLTSMGTEVGAPVSEVGRGFRVIEGAALDGRFDAVVAPRAFNGGIDYQSTFNRPPTATPRRVQTPVDTALEVELRGFDANNDVLTMRITREPEHGTLERVSASDSWRYTPERGFVGADAFGFTAHDGVFESAESLMTIDVVAPQAPVAHNQPPVAHAGGPYRGHEGRTVVLDGSASSDPDGSVQIWRWDCESDGVVDTVGVSAKCRYGDDGVYEVTLTVADDERKGATATARVEIADVAPVVHLSPGVSGPDGTWTFEARVVDPGDEAHTYTWAFGDGSEQRGVGLARVTHAYAEPGRYQVRLTVTDGEGGTGDNALWVEAPARIGE